MHIGHARYALLVFALPLVIAALIEAPIALLSDRMPRRRLLAFGLGALSAALGLCALSDRGWLLSLGLALAGAASGVACGAAQAELVAARPGAAERALTRWTAFASAGDVLAPLWVAVLAYCGASYRSALATIASVIFVHALLAFRERPARSERAGDESQALASAAPGAAVLARRLRLWWMLFAAACCALLDEIVVALAALRLHEAPGCSPAFAAATLAAYSVGGLGGAVAAERLLRSVSARRVLFGSALLSLAALALFIVVRSPLIAGGALLVLGAAAAPQHPLAQAAAYQLAPGKPGLVQALAQALVWIDALLPLAIGAVASAYGLNAALAALALQPLVMLLAVCVGRAAP